MMAESIILRIDAFTGAFVGFPFNVYLAAFVLSWAATTFSFPFWRRWSYRSGLVDDPGHRKIHYEPISLAGGLAVLTGVLVPIVLAAAWLVWGGWADSSGAGAQGSWQNSAVAGVFEYGLSRRAVQLGTILLGAVAMVFLGWLDDKYELAPSIKFTGQVVVAAAVAAAGVRVTLFVENVWFSYAVTILWILTVTNAFNFMDNMNGLCAGLGFIGAWCFGWSAAIQGQYLVATLAALTCGALLGFLPFNFPSATAFLGDAGSHLVGFLLAVLAILPHFYSTESPNSWAVLSPLLILAVPLIDLVWVVIIRWRLGRPFYVGDTNHLSHRLVRRGLSRTRAVLVIWLLAALFGLLGAI